MNYSTLKWIVRSLMVVLAILSCCYIFDLILKGPSSIPIIIVATFMAIFILFIVFELAIVIPATKSNKKLIPWLEFSILRKKLDDYEGNYAPETKPELPGVSKKRTTKSYDKSKVRKPKTNRVTNNKKKN